MRKVNIKQIVKKNSLIVEMIVIFALLTWLTGGMFLSLRNISNILMQGCVYATMGIGITFVLSSRHVDLSGGSIVGVLSTMGAVMQTWWHVNPWVTMAAMIVCGMAIGLWHGYWIAFHKLPAFVVTLSGQLIFRGIVLEVGEGRGIGPVDHEFTALGATYIPTINEDVNDTSIILMVIALAAVILSMLKQRSDRMRHNLSVPSKGRMALNIALTSAVIIGFCMLFISYRGFPTAFVIMMALACIFTFVAQNTRYGRYVFAIGGNRDAAQMSGVNVRRIIMRIYMFQGMLISIASILYLGRTGMATSAAGTGFEFSAITGAVVGGVSTLGGQGTVFGAILGTFLVAGIDNAMSLLNLGSSWQYVVRGGILLFAIAFDVYSKTGGAAKRKSKAPASV
ncbi:MAG: hypothetical protein LBU86_05965 [Oscillospiraceae bacterium]|jgi:D-xylose transport system permease protein|nr:hypothetical protein [Oscillospiraceae bacterium]